MGQREREVEGKRGGKGDGSTGGESKEGQGAGKVDAGELEWGKRNGGEEEERNMVCRSREEGVDNGKGEETEGGGREESGRGEVKGAGGGGEGGVDRLAEER